MHNFCSVVFNSCLAIEFILRCLALLVYCHLILLMIDCCEGLTIVRSRESHDLPYRTLCRGRARTSPRSQCDVICADGITNSLVNIDLP